MGNIRLKVNEKSPTLCFMLGTIIKERLLLLQEFVLISGSAEHYIL